MKNALLLLFFSTFFQNLKGQNLSKYYNEIPSPELVKYDSIKVLTKYKDVILYEVQELSRNKKYYLHHLVLKNKSNKYFKLDEFAELKNDSIIYFLSPPFLSIGGKDKWEEGIWFYADFYKERGKSGVRYNYDSIPENKDELIKTAQTKGIYRFDDNKLIMISKKQSEEAFNENKIDGLYYLPNPGRFYIEVLISELIH